MYKKSSTSSRSPGDVEGQPVAKKTRLVHKTIIYDESVANQWLDEPPLEVWDHHIIPLLGLRDLALARPVCTFFEAYWQEKFSNNVLPLRVGIDIASIDGVMGVIEILSTRREYTKLNPFVVLLGKGDHQITSSWTDEDGDEVETTLDITRSNITFVGTGKDTTTILGGFRIDNLKNITFKNMTVTNTSEDGEDGLGIGLGMAMSNAKVELFDVALKGCGLVALQIISTSETTLVATRCEFANSSYGVFVRGLASATFNNCVVHENSVGIYVEGSTIHLHREASAIHSNKDAGIFAISSAKVIIHLPSHHNTIYNNGGQDRLILGGGTTITNVEDGTGVMDASNVTTLR